MTLSQYKWAIITSKRPTLFLTESGELSGSFEDAELSSHKEAVDRIKLLDEPEKFTKVQVTFSVEV